MLDVKEELQEIKEDSESGTRQHRRRASIPSACLRMVRRRCWPEPSSSSLPAAWLLRDRRTPEAAPMRVVPLTTLNGIEARPLALARW